MEDKQLGQMARNRAFSYQTLIGAFRALPDAEFYKAAGSQEVRDFLKRYEQLGQPSITTGARRILEFFKETKVSESVLENLAVDRTKILRAPQKGKFNPPYESLYCEKEKKDGLLRRLQRIYIRSGFVPVDSGETADFLLIQLDFMRLLIQKGELKQQKEFLNEHLGAWVPRYTSEAQKIGETEFYRGWLEFLEGFLRLEQELL